VNHQEDGAATASAELVLSNFASFFLCPLKLLNNMLNNISHPNFGVVGSLQKKNIFQTHFFLVGDCWFSE